ncbi:2, partial [Durusdinium trenchii]
VPPRAVPAAQTGNADGGMEGAVAAREGNVDFLFEGKVVVITGAGGNFGRAGAEYFAKAGANVAMLEVSESALEEAFQAVEPLIRPGKQCVKMVCDITNPVQVVEVVDRIVRELGRIDHLWNNAGYQGEMKPTHEYPIEDFARVVNINVTGSFVMLQTVAKAMISSKTTGSIVNTASVAALRGTPTMSAYVASKSALIGLTMSTAKDLAPFGIRVNAVSPALIGPGFMWDRQNELHAQSGSPYFSRDPETVASAKVNSVPLKRLGSIDEVVQSVAFLLSSSSSYVTGTNLVVSGGLA